MDVAGAVLGLALMLAGVVVVLIGYALNPCGRRGDDCAGCGTPLWATGFEAVHEGRRWCRSCCRERGIRPWYLTDRFAGEFREEPPA